MDVSAYELKRNELIPLAEEYANQQEGLAPPLRDSNYQPWCDRWNKCFHTKMTRLAEEKGLVKPQIRY